MNSFYLEACKGIGNYVYALIDPDKPAQDPSRFFYIGKGKDNRCFAHAAGCVDLPESEWQDLKKSTIMAIQRTHNVDPEVYIVAHGLSEDEALRIEAILIKWHYMHALEAGNKVHGHHAHEYWLPSSQVNASFLNPIAATSTGCKVLLVSLNGGRHLPNYELIKDQPETLAVRTLGYWRNILAEAPGVQYVAGVFRGLIKCVYHVAQAEGKAKFSIHKEGKWKPRRVRFDGVRDMDREAEWQHRSVIDAAGTTLTLFKRDEASKVVCI